MKYHSLVTITFVAMKPLHTLLLLVSFLLVSCMPLRRIAFKQYNEYNAEQRHLKEIRVSPTRTDDLRGHADRIIDIVHMDLAVSFNWDEHTCLGQATLRIKPYFLPTDSIVLDARNMTFQKIRILDAHGDEIRNLVDYNKRILRLKLERPIQPNEEIKLEMDYVAHPDEAENKKGRAIRDDKGLYFVNTDKSETYQPMQLWTQGETESNSNWFPTIDHPHEKFTSVLQISAPAEMTILSNGRLISDQVSGSKHQQTWANEEPLPAYLLMMAIGNFKISKEQLDNLEISYYLEPDYHPYSAQIFRHTREMIDFFGGKLGVNYPWSKYAQVVVRDYVSGAMENASATLHGESVQKTPRELLDAPNDEIIAHELFHQWFGDLVTCESWPHLFLNEGFATYGEQLWLEYKYGVNASQRESYETMKRYLNYANQVQDGPIANFNYKNPDDMFNTLTYQKGSRVLHLLRSILGDDAFFAGLKIYLTEYRYQTAEIDDFRQVMEKVSGKDLRPFFQQWIFRGAHPVIDVRYAWSDSNATLKVEVEQIQNNTAGTFHFPLSFKVRQGSQVKNYTFQIQRKKEVFYIKKSSNDYVGTPLVIVDPEATFLGELRDHQSFMNLIQTYRKASSFIEKVRPLEALSSIQQQADTIRSTLLDALSDADEHIRVKILEWIDWNHLPTKQRAEPILIQLAANDASPAVRAQATRILGTLKRPDLVALFQQNLNDSSYQVCAEALRAGYLISPKEYTQIALQEFPNARGGMQRQCLEIFIAQKDSQGLNLIKTKIPRLFNRHRAELVQFFSRLLTAINLDPTYQAELEFLRNLADTDKYASVRLSSMKALATIREQYQLAGEASKNKEIKTQLLDRSEQIRQVMILVIKNRPDEWTDDYVKEQGITL